MAKLGAGSAAAAKNRTPSASHPTRSWSGQPDFVAPIELEAGIVLPPVQQYALIENALAAARELGPDAQRDEIAALWARFNAVAAHNPDAAFGAPRTAAEIAMPGPRNRPLAYPYNVWHASQWTVDQSSALVICSAARAARGRRAPGPMALPARRAPLLEGDHADRPANARRVARDGRAGPCRRAPRRSAPARPQARRGVLVLPGGGPGATVRARARPLPHPHSHRRHDLRRWPLQPLRAAVTRDTGVPAARAQPDELGLVTTVSGMLSKPGLALWSATPPSPGRPPLVADLADQAIAATGVVPVVQTAPTTATPARVASFTVTYGGADGLAPVRTAIVADLPDGVRTAATCEDADTARLAVAEGLTGRAVEVKDTSFSL